MKHAPNESGNAFFLILIGIVLFAAFTAVVSKNSREGGGSGNPDMDKLDAQQIIEYGNTLKSAVDQLRTNGISESDIRFANSTVSGYGTVGATPTAEVFHPSGGNITYEAPNPRWLDSTYSAQANYGTWIFTGGNALRLVGAADVTNDTNTFCSAANCKELVAILPYVKHSICQQIANLLNFKTVAGAIPQDNSDYVSTKFVGTYPGGTSHIATATQDSTWGKVNGCLRAGAGGPQPADSYFYFHVLIAR